MGKFGWSLPPGCNRLPGDDDWDDSRCCRCHRDLEQAWEDSQEAAFAALEPMNDSYDDSPMSDGFCCWACARDYADAEATKPYYAHEMPEREEYRRKAAGAQAPEILKEDFDEYFDGGYDPCDDPENPERIDRASVADLTELQED